MTEVKTNQPATNQPPDKSPPPDSATKEAQRARAEETAKNTLEQNTAASEGQSAAGAASAEKNVAATGSPSGTVSAKDNQPVATPVDTGKGKQAPLVSKTGIAAVGETDKMADMPIQPSTPAPAPTQDPPINVDARVPVGSSRVDNTRRNVGPTVAGDALQGHPGGHLGSGPPGGFSTDNPRPLGPNPSARPRGGALKEDARNE